MGSQLAKEQEQLKNLNCNLLAPLFTHTYYYSQ